MFVVYNGIQLQIERITQWSDRNIYSEDNTERLYRHVVMSVQFVINPRATTVENARSAPEAILALKTALLTPRKSLVVTMGATEVLRSPAAATVLTMPTMQAPDGTRTYHVDAKGGPHPIHCDVIQVFGTKTFVGTFTIETWLADDTVRREGAQSPLISHRWEVENDLDEGYFCRRIISGRAIFRADFLYELTAFGDYRQVERRPSDYMAYLAPPVPIDYKREPITTRVSSDGLSVSYTIVDQEQPTVLAAQWPVGAIDAVWRSGHSRPGMLPTATVGYTSFVVQVTGRRDARIVGGASRRQDLINMAILTLQRFGLRDPLNVGMYYQADITVHLVKKMVELSCSYRLSGVADNVVGGAVMPLQAIGGDITRDFPEDVGDILIASRFTPAARPPGGVYGSGQTQLRTQSLRDGNQIPSPAPNVATQPTNNTAEADAAAAAQGDNERRD